MPGTDLDSLVEAAAQALGVRLKEPRLLPGSDRNRVVRASVDGSTSVIIKAPVGGGPGREPAALAVLRQVPGVPEVLVDRPEFVVMADAGSGLSVADRVRGDDPDAAAKAVFAWAEAIGRLQAASLGLRPAFERELAQRSPFGAPAVDLSVEELAADAVGLTSLLPRLGVTPTTAALDALRTLTDDLGGVHALDPGDPCPDNNVETAEGLLLLDFEWAEFRHVGWAAAYLRVPWPTCWCSWLLPPEVTEAALARWRTILGPAVDTPSFERELDLLTAAWAFRTTASFLRRALDGDPPSPDPARQRPSMRALLQHRLAGVAASPVPAPLADLAAETLAASRREWGDCPLALAPAWR